jgi:hypothetical protein
MLISCIIDLFYLLHWSVISVHYGHFYHLDPLLRLFRLVIVGLLLVGYLEKLAIQLDRSVLLQIYLSLLFPRVSVIVDQPRR